MGSRFGWCRVLVSAAMVTAGVVAASGGVASAASTSKKASSSKASSSSKAASSTSGVWPGVGKICGSGPGGATPTTRGVTNNSIHIAVFNDAANTIQPGLEIEFTQFATAFAHWCDAAGGINGRKIVVDNRDAALFNAAQVTSEACQSDFMAVGGGMALDAPSVPVREACGLGQISAYVVSNQSVDSALQVNPSGTNNNVISAGWFGALAKEYPKAVEKAGMGAENSPSITESYEKYRIAAEAQGWKVISYQIPPLSVTDWTPYIQQIQTKGVEALWPPDTDNITPYVQAMDTSGYKPAFMVLGSQFYVSSTTKAAKATPFPTTFVEDQYWPLELASKNPSTALLLSIMRKYSPGDTVDFNDEIAANSWLLWAKSATACGTHLTVSCVLSHAATEKNWDSGGMSAPVKQLAMSNDNPQPSPCFVLLKVEPGKFVYDKTATRPTQSIWNCSPSGLIHFTPSDQKQIIAAS